ncbi:hypothetical protein MUK42_33500 [Musa troglodytarum]|uniref:Uncharacterized protein n=1 Tax=Musa troglodytarum TaxID=320322 RepID=A0A9E7F8Z7_9LILI|nr:hypothetical protein MUK42_33500 [Musa troglodytarum]
MKSSSSISSTTRLLSIATSLKSSPASISMNWRKLKQRQQQREETTPSMYYYHELYRWVIRRVHESTSSSQASFRGSKRYSYPWMISMKYACQIKTATL